MFKKELNISIVEAAKLRILDAFRKNKYMFLSFSGGKDSIVLLDIIINTMQQYDIPFDRLITVFFDEEAIYPDVESIVLKTRSRLLGMGGKFYWMCLPIKHYNCCNKLANDESFICWEPGKQNVWVRDMPKFAIRYHPDFKIGMSYQKFYPILVKSNKTFIGLRAYESLQRIQAISKIKNNKYVYPIYDWRDTDIWNYIRLYNLEIPETYIYLYKTGVAKNKLRISQFFSIDTIKSIPKLLEFYPGLYEKIQRREPNIDLVLLYYDTSMFRSSKQDNKFNIKEKENYKDKLISEIKKAKKRPEDYPGYKQAIRLFSNTNDYTDDKIFRDIYNILITGDPKMRYIRSVLSKINKEKQ